MLTFFIVLCFLLAGLFGLLWLISSRGSESSRTKIHEEDTVTGGQQSKEWEIPKEWNERILKERITSIARSKDLPFLEHFLKSVKVRIIMGQDARTGQKNTEFLRTLIEHLGVTKQVRTAYDDLRLYEKELDIKAKNLEIESLKQDQTIQDLDHQKGTQRKINELKTRVEELEYELQISRLTKNIKVVENPPPPPAPPPPPPTAEEERAANYSAQQAVIDRMKKDKMADLERMNADGASEEEIKRRENMWDDAIFRAEEELRRWM